MLWIKGSSKLKYSLLFMYQGSSVPLVVKWADTEKERLARRAQKAQIEAANMPNANSAQHPSLFGSLPMGYIPPYNGYAYQVLSSFLMIFSASYSA